LSKSKLVESRKKRSTDVERIQAERLSTTPDLSLTAPEAEIMFTIWQSKRPINNEEIAEEHFRIFKPAEKKNETTIRGIINSIKRRELESGRTYLSSIRKRPHTHQIATHHCVHSQGTAVILLELKKGYLVFGRPEMEILRKPFEQYINKKYGKDNNLFKGASDILKRLEVAESNGYVKFVKYGRASGVVAASRLDDDLTYLLFIVGDYLKYESENDKRPFASRLIVDLQSLLSLFGHLPTSTMITKQPRGGN
jgi:hypothetical protein